MTFKFDIENIISNIASNFQVNELAYLALTSKIELPLRDRIAFELHKKFSDTHLICREWKSKESKSSKRVDIAIVDKSNFKPVCLIELKAQSVVRYEKEFTRHLINDLIKIRDISQNDNVELYYIYFNNVINCEQVFEEIYQYSVKYLTHLNKSISTKKGSTRFSIENWNKHLFLVQLNKEKSKHISLKAGQYYNRNISIETFIFGPVKKSEIKTLNN
jgi:hypothetical protein